MIEELPKRKPLRSKRFNYSSPGGYFVTICTHNRKSVLSHIVGAIHESPEIKLTPIGKIVDEVIRKLPSRLHIAVDRYVIMPNHIHLILVIVNERETRAIHESPLRVRSILSKAVGYLKMNASKEIHKYFKGMDLWQRGFHDHVIRGREDYLKIAKYIEQNPFIWELDCFYTESK